MLGPLPRSGAAPLPGRDCGDAAAALRRLILAHWLGTDLPYLTFFGAIMAAAWYGGLRQGLLATALSAAITTSFFLVPRIEADGLEPAHVVGHAVLRRHRLADQRRRRRVDCARPLGRALRHLALRRPAVAGDQQDDAGRQREPPGNG